MILERLKSLGPGLLYAGAAVGVSHLVQSTRAGADYGLMMIAVVIIANVLKYPFFKSGPIYAAQTGKSLLEAFSEHGKWIMGLFYFITVGTMFAVQAVVTLITASVLSSILGLSFALWKTAAVILLCCFLILIIGHYRWLSRVMKWVIVMLTLTTLVTLIAAIGKWDDFTNVFSTSFTFEKDTDVFFLIALVGWMPAPLDISLWHSEWTLAEKGDLQLKRSIFDFNIGYWGTTFLAVAFVALGSFILNGSNIELSSSGAVFAGQIIDMYTNTIGAWSFPFVALAALTTMFSTTLTVLDAFPRILQKALTLSFPEKQMNTRTLYVGTLTTLSVGAILILGVYLQNMKQLVDLATTISFLTAPILGWMIFKVVMKAPSVKQHYSRIDLLLFWLGMIFLLAFSIYFLIMKI